MSAKKKPQEFHAAAKVWLLVAGSLGKAFFKKTGFYAFKK